MKNSPDYLPEYFKKPIAVIGCGNSLRGDDGFGPAVIDRLQKNYKIPEDVCTLDTGTAIRSFLFDLSLSESKPEKIIIIDSCLSINISLFLKSQEKKYGLILCTKPLR